MKLLEEDKELNRVILNFPMRPCSNCTPDEEIKVLWEAALRYQELKDHVNEIINAAEKNSSECNRLRGSGVHTCDWKILAEAMDSRIKGVLDGINRKWGRL